MWRSFKKKLITHFVTSCRELLSLRQILNHPPLCTHSASLFCHARTRRAGAATRHAMAGMGDGRLMGGIFRWGRRASDDLSLIHI